jgi:hypothetical protein
MHRAIWASSNFVRCFGSPFLLSVMRKGEQSVTNFIKTLSKLGVAFEGDRIIGSMIL